MKLVHNPSDIVIFYGVLGYSIRDVIFLELWKLLLAIWGRRMTQNNNSINDSTIDKKCFVVCPIGEIGTETRKRSDQIFKHIISPVLESLGYEPVRADKISISGSITTKIIEHLIHSDLVIADLTGNNPNVFYELGVRHAFGKAFIQIVEEDGTKLPFDIADLRTIKVNHRDLDSVHDCRMELTLQIKALENGEEIKTPISQTVNIEALKASSDPAKNVMAEILDNINDLTNSVRALQLQQIAFPTLADLTESRMLSNIYPTRQTDLYQTLQTEQNQGLSDVSTAYDWIQVCLLEYNSQGIREIKRDALFLPQPFEPKAIVQIKREISKLPPVVIHLAIEKMTKDGWLKVENDRLIFVFPE